MRHLVPVAPLLAALVLQAGCRIDPGTGADRNHPVLRLNPLLEEPPNALVFAGEVKDFATYRPEPEAVIEFWSEHPSYTPTATLDGRGGFSVRIDRCRRPPGQVELAADQVARSPNVSCKDEIGRFGLRARKGRKCSIPVDQAPPAGRGPHVLWLRDCAPPASGDHDWRPLPQTAEPPAPG